MSKLGPVSTSRRGCVLYELGYPFRSLYGEDLQVVQAALAFGNFKLAVLADREELPDTQVQRFLAYINACVYWRARVGAETNLAELRLITSCADLSFLRRYAADEISIEFAEEDENYCRPVTFVDALDLFEIWVARGEQL